MGGSEGGADFRPEGDAIGLRQRAARIEEFPLSGAPLVLLDATATINGERADWNAANGPTTGCECRTSRRGLHGAGWLGLVLLLGLRGRRRGRALLTRAG